MKLTSFYKNAHQSFHRIKDILFGKILAYIEIRSSKHTTSKILNVKNDTTKSANIKGSYTLNEIENNPMIRTSIDKTHRNSADAK